MRAFLFFSPKIYIYLKRVSNVQQVSLLILCTAKKERKMIQKFKTEKISLFTSLPLGRMKTKTALRNCFSPCLRLFSFFIPYDDEKRCKAKWSMFSTMGIIFTDVAQIKAKNCAKQWQWNTFSCAVEARVWMQCLFLRHIASCFWKICYRYFEKNVINNITKEMLSVVPW